MKIEQSSILLQGVRFYARHGVDPQERQIGAEFVVDLRVDADCSPAVESDLLEGTVNYATLYRLVKEEMDVPSQLVEHVAGRIAKRIFSECPTAHRIQLKLIKRNPPMGADSQGAGVELTCTRE